MADAASPIRFDDGAAYERFMGAWSQLAGRRFLEWIGAPRGARWLDVGCGNGAFTELIVQEAGPASVIGVDPSPAQLEYAQHRFADGSPLVRFDAGDAQVLPVPDDSVDVAVMPLVLFFVPEPARGVAELVRVVRPGGFVSAYVWDMEGGGFPYHALHEAIRAHGGDVPMPPRPEASRLDELERLWREAGVQDVALETIHVTRRFTSFDEYWAIVSAWRTIGLSVEAIDDGGRQALRAAVRDGLPVDADGGITVRAWAHAVKGAAPAR